MDRAARDKRRPLAIQLGVPFEEYLTTVWWLNLFKAQARDFAAHEMDADTAAGNVTEMFLAIARNRDYPETRAFARWVMVVLAADSGVLGEFVVHQRFVGDGTMAAVHQMALASTLPEKVAHHVLIGGVTFEREGPEMSTYERWMRKCAAAVLGNSSACYTFAG